MKEAKEKRNLEHRAYLEKGKTDKLKAKQREKGITLIALVITIIVLLILAGVSLSMILSQDRNI